MNRLRELRKENNLSQHELAVRVGVTPKYISFIEAGKRTPSLSVADKISKEFGKTVDEIFLAEKCT